MRSSRLVGIPGSYREAGEEEVSRMPGKPRAAGLPGSPRTPAGASSVVDLALHCLAGHHPALGGHDLSKHVRAGHDLDVVRRNRRLARVDLAVEIELHLVAHGLLGPRGHGVLP